MQGKIFVSYRRDDERAMAARIRDRLAQVFGEGNVFMDVDHLSPGQRFDVELHRALRETSVFIAIIGSRWLNILQARRASREPDFVRAEIASAINYRIPVIPLLLEGTPLPRPQDLPDDIRGLMMHQIHMPKCKSYVNWHFGLRAWCGAHLNDMVR